MPVVNVGANCGSLSSPDSTTACVYSYSKADDTRVLRVHNAIADINDFTSAKFDTAPSVKQYRVILAWDPTMDVQAVANFSQPNGYTRFIKGDPRVRYIYSEQEIDDLGATPVTYTNGAASKKRPLVILINIDNPKDGFYLVGSEGPLGPSGPGSGIGNNITSANFPPWIATPPPSYTSVIANSYSFIPRAGCTAPSVSYSASCWFVMDNDEYDGGPGQKQYFLTKDGNVYDINQPLADTTKPWRFSVQVTQNIALNKYIVSPIAPTTWPATSMFYPLASTNSLKVEGGTSISGSIYVTIAASGGFVGTTPYRFRAVNQDPVQSAEDVSGLSENTIFSCVSVNPAIVMGWGNATDTMLPKAPYQLVTKQSYFSYMTYGPNQGFFNLIPVTGESLAPPSTGPAGLSGQYFFMFSGDNAQMFFVNPANNLVTTQATPASFYRQAVLDSNSEVITPGSLQTKAEIADMYKYGAWRFENIQDSTAVKQTFRLVYTGPTTSSNAPPGSTQSLNPKVGVSGNTYYLRYSGSINVPVATSSTDTTIAKFTCTVCSVLNGTCTPSASAISGSGGNPPTSLLGMALSGDPSPIHSVIYKFSEPTTGSYTDTFTRVQDGEITTWRLSGNTLTITTVGNGGGPNSFTWNGISFVDTNNTVYTLAPISPPPIDFKGKTYSWANAPNINDVTLASEYKFDWTSGPVTAGGEQRFTGNFSEANYLDNSQVRSPYNFKYRVRGNTVYLDPINDQGISTRSQSVTLTYNPTADTIADGINTYTFGGAQAPPSGPAFEAVNSGNPSTYPFTNPNGKGKIFDIQVGAVTVTIIFYNNVQALYRVDSQITNTMVRSTAFNYKYNSTTKIISLEGESLPLGDGYGALKWDDATGLSTPDNEYPFNASN